jgi:hypothetical protein
MALWDIVEQKTTKRSGSVSRSTSYLEYYNDILAHILIDIISCINSESITPSMQAKIDILNTILEHSSIDINDISNPLEGYKVAGLIEVKDINKEIRQMYMNAILNSNE